MEKTKRQKVGAVIVAAGGSLRMGGTDKMLARIGGRLVLTWAVYPFQQSSLVDQITVVLSGENRQQCQTVITGEEWSKVTNFCLGGKRRQDSVAAGLAHLEHCDWVIVHDGARPLVTVELIERGLEAARETGAAAAAVPVTDTIKIAGEDGIVLQTPPRQNLWAVQTPQVFRYDIITEAYRKSRGEVTDDASLVEQAGYQVRLFPGANDNIKITTSYDLPLAEVLLKKHER